MLECSTLSDAKLLKNFMEVMFYGAFRDAKAFCNNFVTQAGLSERRYLLLAACQFANSANRQIMRLLHSTLLQQINV